MTNKNPNDNNRPNDDGHQSDSMSFGINTPLSRIMEKSDFFLLSPDDIIGLDKSPTEEQTRLSVEESGIETFDVSSETLPYHHVRYVQTNDSELPRLGNFYEFRECIGVGGFCYIHKGYDVVLQRDVAIKTLREEHNNRYSRRDAFITEAKVTAVLDHPNIIPIHGLFTDEKNQIHLVIKLIEGMNLREILLEDMRRYKKMTRKMIVKEEKHKLVDRLEIFLKVCDAISYAHNRKILHRDIKPGNIMVGQFHEVYVMDWGIAEFRDMKTQKKKNTIQGTPQYLSPEIVTTHAYDRRSDIYSLGVMLFNLVYLKKAFPSNVKIEDLFKMKINSQTTPMKHTFDVKIPRALNYIIRKAIAPEPAVRYQTVKAMADDLHQFLRGESVMESLRVRMRKIFTSLFLS